MVDKGGKLYWQPAKRLREGGFHPVRLSEDRTEAYRTADELNRRVDLWRAGDPLAIAQGSKPAAGTIGWLIANFRSSEDWNRLRDRTRKDYARHLDAIEAMKVTGTLTVGALAMKGLTPAAVQALRVAAQGMGHRQGAYRMQVLRLLLNYAVRIGELDKNPAERQRVRMPKSRDVVWTQDQVEAFRKMAQPDMELALDLALWTGQRQGDVLKMRWDDIQDSRIVIVQNKTGAKVDMPVARQLAEALARAPRHHEVILTGSDHRPWREGTFRAAWIKTQKRAGLTGVSFLDLRRTAVCALAEAGCSTPEIAAITGHSQISVLQIIETYLKPTRKLADAAMKKLEG